MSTLGGAGSVDPILASGIIASGYASVPFWGQLASSLVQSTAYPFPLFQCTYCHKALCQNYASISLPGTKYRSIYCCLECLSDGETFDYSPRELSIRVSSPLQPGTHRLILADWCDEQNRPNDAKYLRKLETKQGE